MDSSDIRNAKVVVAFIASMTLGAAVLLSLAPQPKKWNESALLLAESGDAVESVEICYAVADERIQPADYECLIFPDGEVDWRRGGKHVRLLVIGAHADALADVQARALLGVLANINQGRTIADGAVTLAAASDARQNPKLPGEARDLAALLVRKGFVD